MQGNTPGTKEGRDCGNSGISNLAENHLELFSCSVKGFSDQIEVLEAMGYLHGITY